MRTSRNSWHSFIAASVGVTFLIVLYSESVSSDSVDTALHYVLVEGWYSWRPILDPTMSLYPPLAHIAAAALARLTYLSPFQALFCAGIAFVFGTYFFLVLGMKRHGKVSTLFATAAFLVFVWKMNNSWSIYGFEIIGHNMFLAQTGGELAFLALIWLYSDHEFSPRRLLLAPIFVALIASIYPLSAIKSAAALSLLLIIQALRLRARRPIVLYGLIIASMIAIVALHPAFRFMARIADNGGGIDAWIGDLDTLRRYNMLLFCLSTVSLLLARKSTLVRPHFLASVALASATVASLQDLALSIGFGSEYAVRKHTYAIIGLLGAVCISLSVEILTRALPGKFDLKALGSLSSGALTSLTAFAAVYTLISTHAKSQIAFLRYQNEIRENTSLRGTALSSNDDFATWQNYAVTFVDLGNSIDLAVKHNLGIDVRYGGPMPSLELISINRPVEPNCKAPLPLVFSQLQRTNCSSPRSPN